MFARILIVGYGSMASAMVEGWLASGIAPERFTIHDPEPKDVPAKTRYLATLPDESFDVIILGFKPQVLDSASVAIEPLAGPDTTVISILAGTGLDALSRRFPRANAIVRLMPNLAAALGKSANVLFGRGLDGSTKARVTDMTERLGSADWMADEDLADLVTALTGSGPGFVYRFIDALAEGARALGMEARQAERLAVAMVDGAAALSATSPLSPHGLANRVASPGGTTARGLAVLDENDALARLVEACLRAARDRGREIAAESQQSD